LKIKKGVKIESYWAKLMSKSLNSRNIADLLLSGGNNSKAVSTTTTVSQQPADNKPKQ
jgi:ribosomal protein L12E/L44/L45/RPP1/RPP2